MAEANSNTWRISFLEANRELPQQQKQSPSQNTGFPMLSYEEKDLKPCPQTKTNVRNRSARGDLQILDALGLTQKS